MLENKSVKEIISDVHSGKYKVKEVVKFYLDRIEAHNPSLNAIVSKKNDDEIIKQAEKYDLDNLKKKPLAGLPFASKDLLDVNGFPTTYGFPGYKNYFPNKNSLIVDDVYETGFTLNNFKNIEGAYFFVLVSKKKPIWWNTVNTSLKTEWIVFPWENKNDELIEEKEYQRKRDPK